MLAGLPVVMFVLPALAGLPVMPGDDHTQNFPLRVLAGLQLRHGHLPLFDPYIWSGTPLLGGWNAGAAYPLTLLFAVLPPVAAWTANMIVTWWVAGLGTFAFLRASRLSPVASFLGAFSFAFAGAMTAQIPHFGLVTGMSWVPVALLATLRLSESGGRRARVAWASALAAAMAMVILAGEPRAIDDAAIIVALYAGWRAWRLGRWRQGSVYLGLVLAGLALGVALGAVQWVPGVEAIATSQRVAHSAFLFDSGSLARKRLLLSLVPDLLGGSGSFGQPAFLGTYSLTEVTGYVGLMPLAAACALLPRLRWRRPPEWVIWHLVALVGVLLALGGNTPLGKVLVQVPFFGDQRLQSRNLIIADFALAVLLAYWVDIWRAEPGTSRRWRVPASHLLAALPGLAAVGVAVATIAWGAGMLRWLGLSPDRAAHAGPLRPWLVPSLVLGALAVAVVWWGPRLEPRRRVRILAWFVAADITAFTLLTVIAVAPGLGSSGPPATAASGSATPGSATAGSATTAGAVPVGTLTHGGRFAVYDPGLLYSGELSTIGVADGNVMTGTPSVEGYTSIVDGTYATATGSHQPTGDGQNVLAPRAIGDGTLDQLDTTVLLAPAAYLITPADPTPADPTPASTTAASAAPAGTEQAGTSAGASTNRGTGFRSVPAKASATWYLGSRQAVTSITFPPGATPGTRQERATPGTHQAGATPGAAATGMRVGLVDPAGSVRWLATAPAPGGSVTTTLTQPFQAVAIRVAAGTRQVALGPPVVGTAGGAGYRADGVLQDALVPPRWRFTGLDGHFAVFSDTLAKPALTLQPVTHGRPEGAAVKAAGGPGFAPTSAQVSSPHGVTVIRSVAAIAGWRAAWYPAGRRTAQDLPVRRAGLVQAVRVPPGGGTLTWAYDPPAAHIGLWVSLAALVVLIGANVTPVPSARYRGRGEGARPAKPPGLVAAPQGTGQRDG